jgi:hypothetical protein
VAPTRPAAGAPATEAPAPPAAAAEAPPPALPPLAEQRKYLSFLPPFFSRATTLEQHGPGLWGLVQELRPPGQADIRLRMTAARLDGGGLVLVGPVAPTQEMLGMLRSLGGEVAHIVVPNTSPEHFLFAPALAAAFPTATLWTVPGFYAGAGLPLPGRSWLFAAARARNPCATLGLDPLPADLEGQMQVALLDVPLFLEAAVALPRHRALLLADTGVCLAADDPEYAAMPARGVQVARRLGVWDRLGPVTRVLFERHPEAGRAWVEAVLGFDFEVVLPAHGSAPVRGGPAAVAACFDFLFAGGREGGGGAAAAAGAGELAA